MTETTSVTGGSGDATAQTDTVSYQATAITAESPSKYLKETAANVAEAQAGPARPVLEMIVQALAQAVALISATACG